MPRVKTNVASHKRRKKILKSASGYTGSRHRLLSIARETVDRARRFSYIHRKQKKREFRSLWIQRINAAVRPFGLSYSLFIAGLSKAEVVINRKVLADMAIKDPEGFESLVKLVRGN
ncbi:MAG: 50S ribosomal protein L20 [Candidatus Glassbacteria bacterium RIFCSPLOWO2_12_FULL_58_11]|uniref:Large ribosomal subunit protein bL20 n=2 Tax=Candidatus Glassiibacteriota TaxID=1817805 RepID=A0A1F5Z351_9BACT|nr:MAG: 50S ribosomal protein L20 [Candidatus Glassbacteria bacterium GWA2_58_10]OGG06880.1 MAG: 50S ribosomal protein L20 [Candidatus Glassbacteria bacterium RIFCSPLOWO2_12_FULL_58_11]